MQEKANILPQEPVGVPVPASWTYGSFHPNSRFFNNYNGQSNQQNTNRNELKVQPLQKEKRVVPEDYYRVLKEKKEVEQNLKAKKQTGFAQRSKMESGFDSINKQSKYSPEKQGGISALYGISEIDPEMDDEEALNYIELPPETLYLIDKVVRLRSKAGPIGVDNSELINIELEEEYKEKNQYLQNLVAGKQNTKTQSSGETQNENKENIDNQRLLDRLTAAATKINQPYQASVINQSKMSRVQRSQIGDRSQNAYSHEEWIRRKEHETKLKEQLIREAKRDRLEEIRRKQAEEEIKRQEKQLALMQWEEKKRQDEEMKRQEQLKKEQREKLEKQIKQESSYKVFKDWLKQSLIKQRQEMIMKKMKEQEKRELEEREKKAKANKKVMAKIAYKEWKEKKLDEAKHFRKIERLQRREEMMQNSEEKRKGEVLLAYGLNKNLKKLRERPKSAKPQRKTKKEKRNKQRIEFNENF